MPRVSVVIPSFNRLDLLPRALASIEQQTFRDFDIVIVNDGGDWSSDIESSAFAHSAQVIHRANGGPGAARNSGVAVTDSEFIAYLDDDDQWHPKHLETLLGISTSLSADMVFSVADVRDQGSRLRLWGDCDFNKFILDGFYTVFPLSACIHRRAPLSTVGGFDESPLLIGPEDCEFIIRYSDVCRVAASRVCSVTMHRERSMTRAPREEWVDTLDYVIRKLGYRESRRNWLMLYRAFVAALNEGRDEESREWAAILDDLLPSGVSRSGSALKGLIELSPWQLKAFCRSALAVS